MPYQPIVAAFPRLLLGRLLVAQAIFLSTLLLEVYGSSRSGTLQWICTLWAIDAALSALDYIAHRKIGRPIASIWLIAAYSLPALLAALVLPVDAWLILLLLPTAIVHGGARLGRNGFILASLCALPAVYLALPQLASLHPVLAFAAVLAILIAPAYQAYMVWDLQRSERSMRLEHARRERFLATMSHELRTPLNTISQSGQILTAERLTARQHHLLQLINTASASLLNTINEVLDLSRIDQDRLMINPEAFNVRALALDVRSVLSPQADAKHLDLAVEVRDDVPDVLVADPARIKQIIINLGGNSIRFTDRGSVTISFRLASGESILRIQVADTGPGIPEPERDRVFEPFYQASTGVARTHGGSGLGLGIVAGIVRAMRGSIELSDNPGGGLLATIDIPAEHSSSKEANALAQTNHIAQLFANHIQQVPSQRILIVEDNALNAESLMATLRHAGHRPEIVEDGAKAIELIRTVPYDLVLLDLNMPTIDGWAVLEALDKTPGLAQLPPIIICTADHTPEARETSLSLGAHDFVTKPVDIPRLLALIASRAGEPSRTGDPLPPTSIAHAGSDVIETMRRISTPDAFREFAATVLDGYRDYARSLERGRQSGDREFLRSVVHDLKSDAGAHRLIDLQHAAARLESSLKDSFDPHELDELSQLLVDATATVKARLEALMTG